MLPRTRRGVGSLFARTDTGFALPVEAGTTLACVRLEAQRRWYPPTVRDLAVRLNITPLAIARDGTIWQRTLR